MPPGAGGRVAHARLLRLGQPQPQGRLPAVHGLVRREPGEPLGPSAGRGRARATSRRWVASTRRSPSPARPTTTATTDGSSRCCKHVVFSDETSRRGPRPPGRRASSSSAFGAENGTWRNAFLSGAHELRHGSFGTPTATAAEDLIDALSVDQMLDTIAIRIDGPKAWDEHIVLSFVITDTDTTHVAELRNGVMHHRVADAPDAGRHHVHAHPAHVPRPHPRPRRHGEGDRRRHGARRRRRGRTGSLGRSPRPRRPRLRDRDALIAPSAAGIMPPASAARSSLSRRREK